jgi:hypothetical protein
MMTWTMTRPGRWNGTDGTHNAVAIKMREGALHSNDWMWFVQLDGVHLANADTLADAKAVVAKELGGSRGD